MANKAFEFTDSNFQETAKEITGVAVVDFWAPWCGPCRQIGPIIEELAEEYAGKAVIGKVNVDNNPTISFDYKIRSIPTILILKDGKEVDKIVGLTSRKVLVDKIENAIQVVA